MSDDHYDNAANEDNTEENNFLIKPNEEVENVNTVNDFSTENEVDDNHLFEAGDVYVYESGVVALTVLSVSDNTKVGRIIGIRLFSSTVNKIEVAEEDFRAYLRNNAITKLFTFKDQMMAISDKIVFNPDDFYTRNGEEFIKILSTEMTYIDNSGKYISIVGCEYNGLVAYRDTLEIKGLIYDESDQFRDQNN